MKPLLTTFIFIMSLISCMPSTNTPENQDGLANSQWLLEQLNGYPKQFGVIPLAFDGQRFSGSDGCNTVFGPYTQTGVNKLLINTIASTMRACLDKTNAFSQAYTQMLGKVRGFKINNNHLELLDDQNQVLAIYIAQPDQLTGTEWLLSGLNNGKAGVEFRSTDMASAIQIAFQSNGKVIGKTSCNNFSGLYHADPKIHAIHISQLQITEKNCPPDIAEDERLLSQALQNSTTYRRTGNALELRDAEGALQMALQAMAKP